MEDRICQETLKKFKSCNRLLFLHRTMTEIYSPHNLEFVIADLVKKLEDQKAEAERQLKVLSRQIKVRELENAEL